MKEPIVVEAVRERDIDLLLLEELHSSSEYQTWFITQIHDGEKSKNQKRDQFLTESALQWRTP